MSDEKYYSPVLRARRPAAPESALQSNARAQSSAYNVAEGVSSSHELPATNTASRHRSKKDLKTSTSIPAGQSGRSGHRSSSGFPNRLVRLVLLLLLFYIPTMCYKYYIQTQSSHSRAQMLRNSQPPFESLDTVLETFQETWRLPGILNVTTPNDYNDLFKALNVSPWTKKSREIKQDLPPLASLLKNMNIASLDIKMFVMAQKLFLLTDIRPSMDFVADTGQRGLDRLSDIPDLADYGLNALSVVAPVIQRHHAYDPYIRRLQAFTDETYYGLSPLIHRGVNAQNMVHDIISQVEHLSSFLEEKEITFASKCVPSSSRWATSPNMCSLIHISQVLQNSTQALQALRYEVSKATASLDAFQKVAPPIFGESPEVLIQIQSNILSLLEYSGEIQKVYDKLK